MSWLGTIEGYYGVPLTHAQRIDLMAWMATESMDVFCYAPKDDPLHRHQWRDPYPDDDLARFEELVRVGKQTGVDFCFTISPGLDWHDGDEAPLIDKLKTIAGIGCTSFGVLWDDVPAGEDELGRTHGTATAKVADAVGGSRWWTVGTDYALGGSTPYLAALSETIGPDITLAWTGPKVVPLDITAASARELSEALGRKLLLWENFPVNDGPMAPVLHLGPYPQRDPRLPDASDGVLLNLMPQAICNRIGVACGARFWRDPLGKGGDREATWREVVASYPGLEQLALASRSWVGEPGPSPYLAALADAAPDDHGLREYLERGCRDGLDPTIAQEAAPWLDAWDREAQSMLMCLDVLERGYRSGARGMAIGVLWTNARKQEYQTFGIRNAVYPVFQQRGKITTMDAEGVVVGSNLTDALARRTLAAT